MTTPIERYIIEASAMATAARAELATLQAGPVGRCTLAQTWTDRLAELRAEAHEAATQLLAAVDARLAAERRAAEPSDWAEVNFKTPGIVAEVGKMTPGSILAAYTAARAAGDRASAYILEAEGRRRLAGLATDPQNLNPGPARAALEELNRLTGDFDRRRAEAEKTLAAGLAEVDAAIPTYAALVTE